MLTTVTDVKAYAKRRYLNFDYETRYPDDVIINMIGEAQGEIESETGNIFDKQSIEDEKYDHKGKSIIVDKYPIISVESVTIDGETQDLTKIRFNKKAGIIYLDKLNTLFPCGWPRTHEPHDVVTEYTGCYDPPFPQAKALCTALVVLNMYYERETPPSLQMILQDENSDVTTKVSTSENIASVVFDIKNKFSKLPINRPLGRMI